MIRSAPICLAESTPSRPTAPSPTTATVDARLHVGRVGGEPAGAQHVGERQQARDQVVRGNIRRGHQRAVRERDAQQRRLRAADELAVLARRLVAGLAVGAGVVGGEERADDELPRLDRRDRAADLLDDAAVLVPHRGRLVDRLMPR